MCQLVPFKMKTVILLILVFSISKGEKILNTKKRGTLHFSDTVLLPKGLWKQISIPLHETDTISDKVKNYHISNFNPVEIDLSSSFHNSIEKPVDEPQEYVPPQTIGTAIIPSLPPPATPVNALASNIPASGGAVYLGSGSLGVVDLGNGAYVLGSGSLGYSMNRAQPRPSINSPVFPPLPASPNLIPAAVPSPGPPQQPIDHPFDPNKINYLPPTINGYEYLPPNRIRFGMPPLRIPMIRTTQQFATPTNFIFKPNPTIPTPSFHIDFSLNGSPQIHSL